MSNVIQNHEGHKAYKMIPELELYNLVVTMSMSNKFYESLTDQGFAATGIGDVFAYTILGNYYRKDIDISRGIILAYRVIKTAIETGAWGLGEPIDIWTLTCNGPRQIKGPELDAVRDAYGASREKLN